MESDIPRKVPSGDTAFQEIAGRAMLGERWTCPVFGGHRTADDQAWVGDITFIPTAQGWLYLAVLLDLFSRRVIGWSMGETIDRSLYLAASLPSQSLNYLSVLGAFIPPTARSEYLT